MIFRGVRNAGLIIKPGLIYDKTGLQPVSKPVKEEVGFLRDLNGVSLVINN